MSDIAIDAMDSGENLFLDETEGAEETAETTESTAEETTAAPAETQEEQTTETAAPDAIPETDGEWLTIKYNHEERKISRAEAKELAERGMALDKVRADLDAERNSRAYSVLDKYAARNNMTREQYVEYLEQNDERLDLREAEKNVRRKYPGLTDEAAKEMARLQVTQQTQQKQLESKAKAEQAQEMRRAASVQDWTEFLQDYPDLTTPDKIPIEVQEAVRKGSRPLSAMQKYELAKAREETEALRAQLETKQKTQAKNKQNKATAMGSVTETREADSYDAFAEGFLKG